MNVYVAEISGRGVLAFEAANDLDAEERLLDRTLVRDLRVLQHQGKPLWDGVSKMRLREPKPMELDIWHTEHNAATALLSDEDDKSWRVFLVAVVDPSEFDDDDDDDD